MLPNSSFPMDLEITKGDDGEIPFIFDDEDGNPIDISLWNFFYTAKVSYSDPDSAAVITIDPADVVKSDSGSGTVDTATFLILNADTSLLTPGQHYVQDVQTVVGGRVKTLGSGTLVITEEVTQRTS